MTKYILHLLLHFTIVFSVYADETDIKLPQTKLIDSETGRYVFNHPSDSQLGLLLLDTKTGRIWQVAKDDDSQIMLKSIPIDPHQLAEKTNFPRPGEALPTDNRITYQSGHELKSTIHDKDRVGLEERCLPQELIKSSYWVEFTSF